MSMAVVAAATALVAWLAFGANRLPADARFEASILVFFVQLCEIVELP